MLLALAMMAAGPQEAGSILVDRDRIDRQRTPREPVRDKPRRSRADTARVAAAGAAAAIAGIRFQGARAPAPVAEAAQRFLGRQASKDNLVALAAALSDAYGRSDVALYTVAIPEQDFSTGVVTVLLTEGRVARAQVKAREGTHPLLRARMAPLLGETPLTRATFERQVTLMRAIPGLTIETDFADPQADGALVMTVTPRQRRTRFTTGYSNRGVALLGDGQLDARAEFYGLVRDGDQLTLSGSAASDLERYRLASAAYAVPLTPAGLTLSANAGYLVTRPRGVPVRGKAKLAGATLSYPLVRGFNRAIDLSLGVDAIDSDNALFGNLLASERTRAVRAGASFTDAREKRTVSFAASASRGLDAAGARVTAPFAEAGFLKANASASAAQALGRRAALRVTAGGQFTRDRLPAAERFGVGGEAFGRAFDTGLLTADRGLGASAELAVRPVKAEILAGSELYGFVDGAWLGVLGRGVAARTDLSLASAGAGVRLRWRDKGELGLEAARPIDTPYPGIDDDWRLTVSWRLSL